jgi:hypothetical protein
MLAMCSGDVQTTHNVVASSIRHLRNQTVYAQLSQTTASSAGWEACADVALAIL